jgi:hypothetical protein
LSGDQRHVWRYLRAELDAALLGETGLESRPHRSSLLRTVTMRRFVAPVGVPQIGIIPHPMVRKERAERWMTRKSTGSTLNRLNSTQTARATIAAETASLGTVARVPDLS